MTPYLFESLNKTLLAYQTHSRPLMTSSISVKNIHLLPSEIFEINFGTAKS